MIPLECSRGKEVIDNHETLKFRIMIKLRIKPTILKFRGLLYGGGVAVSVMGKRGGEDVYCKHETLEFYYFNINLPNI